MKPNHLLALKWYVPFVNEITKQRTGQFRLRALMYDSAINPNSQVSKEQRGMLTRACDLILVHEKDMDVQSEVDLSQLDDLPLQRQIQILDMLQEKKNKKDVKRNAVD
ncbi:hypothetical protein FACS1894189_7480 [Planctomycetales bacterium]|nr:hypothetical protein FACS1894189_7480 [Planctomycetales bacterium]